MRQITSVKDPLVIAARELTSARGRKESGGKCLLEGQQQIEWAVDAHIPVEVVFCHDKLLKDPFSHFLSTHKIECVSVGEGILKKITETSYLVPFVGVADISKSEEVNGDFIVVLDNLQDHGNIGTIVRTASAFGVKTVLTTRSGMDLFYKKSIDASRGKVFEVGIQPFVSEREAIEFLRKKGFQIVATSPHAAELQSLIDLKKGPVALILGNETDGVSQSFLEAADYLVQIPMSGDVESLNVAVAAGISLYELKIRMVISMMIEKIQANLGRQVNVTGKMIQMVFDAVLKKVTWMTSTQAILLMILKCDKRLTLEQARVDTASFGEKFDILLQPLEREGLVQVVEMEGGQGLELTYKGEETIAKLWLVVEKCEESILDGFTAQEKKVFDESLLRIQQNCEKMLKLS